METLDLEKNTPLFNLINYQQDFNDIYLYAKYPYETKYIFLVQKRESTGLKHLNDSEAFIEYSNVMDYNYIEEHNVKE